MKFTVPTCSTGYRLLLHSQVSYPSARATAVGDVRAWSSAFGVWMYCFRRGLHGVWRGPSPSAPAEVGRSPALAAVSAAVAGSWGGGSRAATIDAIVDGDWFSVSASPASRNVTQPISGWS